MVKPLAIVGLALVVLVATPLSFASTDSIEAACLDPHLWLASSVPPGLLELVCSIQDDVDPVSIAFGSGSEDEFIEQNSGTEKYGLAIHESGLPEETRQQLLLLLALWGQE